MRDEQQRSAIAREEALEPLDRFDVEMVGRFVQHKDVGLANQGLRQQGAALLPARERVEAEMVFEGDERYRPVDRLVGNKIVVRIFKPLEDQLLDRALHLRGNVLAQPPYLEPRLADDFPAIRLDGSGDNLQKRRLSLAVAPDEANAFVPLDLQRGVVEQQRSAEGFLDIL